jgi:hypothetical protein
MFTLNLIWLLGCIGFVLNIIGIIIEYKTKLRYERILDYKSQISFNLIIMLLSIIGKIILQYK